MARKALIIIVFILGLASMANAINVKVYTNGAWRPVLQKTYHNGAWNTKYHLYIGMGQSNASGYGDYTQSPVVEHGIEIRYTGDIINGISDPVGYGTVANDDPFWRAQSGSLWPSFAQRYYELTGIEIIIMSLCKGSSGQCPEATYYDDYWTMRLYNIAKIEIDEALAQLTAAGYNYTFKGVIWYQGENDAFFGISESAYKACANQMIDQFFTDYAAYPEISFNMIAIPTTWGALMAQWQAEICAARTRTFLTDNINESGWPHLDQADLNTIGVRVANDIVGRLP